MRRVTTRFLLVLSLLTALLGSLAVGTAGAAVDPSYRILNYKTGGSLLPYGYGNNANDGIYMYAWDPGYTLGGDQWTFENVRGDYLIRNNKTGKCLTPGGAFSGKTYLTQGACNPSYEFRWTLVPGPLGYKIVSRSSHQVMTPYYGNSYGEVVVLEPNSDIAKNWWSITPY